MHPLIIEIASTQVMTRSGVSKISGNPYTMREQFAYVHKPGEPYPEKIKISLDHDVTPYGIGNYILAPSSFYVDRYDSLAVKPLLVPYQPEISNPPIAPSIPDGVKKS